MEALFGPHCKLQTSYKLLDPQMLTQGQTPVIPILSANFDYCRFEDQAQPKKRDQQSINEASI